MYPSIVCCHCQCFGLLLRSQLYYLILQSKKMHWDFNLQIGLMHCNMSSVLYILHSVYLDRWMMGDPSRSLSFKSAGIRYEFLV
jgi:hypothetical protein